MASRVGGRHGRQDGRAGRCVVSGALASARRMPGAVLLLAAAACSNDDANMPLELTPTMACNEAAAHSEGIGPGPSELVRAERTTGKRLGEWLASRHGSGGPAQTAAPTTRPGDLIDVCVFRTASPGAISMPDGSSSDTTGARVFVRFGGVTLDAVGDPAQLARDLDSLPESS